MPERTNAQFWSRVQARLKADIRTLVADGVRAEDVSIEAPGAGGRRTDLVLRGTGSSTDIEFKFPREPRAVNAADTMAVGSIVNDLLRLAESTSPRKLAVHLFEERFVRHLARREDVRLLAGDGAPLVLTPDQLARLPRSAAVMFAGRDVNRGAQAACIYAQPVGDLTLQVLVVAPWATGATERRPD